MFKVVRVHLFSPTEAAVSVCLSIYRYGVCCPCAGLSVVSVRVSSFGVCCLWVSVCRSTVAACVCFRRLLSCLLSVPAVSMCLVFVCLLCLCVCVSVCSLSLLCVYVRVSVCLGECAFVL